jgi:hypothetical protein
MNAQEFIPAHSTKFTIRKDALLENKGTYALLPLIQVARPQVVISAREFSQGFELTEQRVRSVVIRQGDLPKDEPYGIKRDIPAKIIRDNVSEYTAEIAEANLAATGQTPIEAFTNLVFELLDAFDYLSANQSRLGPEPIRQWKYLRDHIGKTDNGSR